MRTKSLAILTGAALLATGCSSKATKPTNENFMKGLNAYYANRSDCLFPNALSFPYEVSPGPHAKADKQRMDALTDAGLLKHSNDLNASINFYALTPAGERAGGRFCYGHREVTSIDSFTPPEKVNGMLQTHVTYHYKMMEVPVWARTDQMLKAFPDMANALSGNATGENTLANAGVGWQVPD
ncbi:MAG TPA: hypothetical protein VHB45_08765 [Alloacidobacterium sp.]|nr:hypothetical protein [Alloacidobacterium sp.]